MSDMVSVNVDGRQMAAVLAAMANRAGGGVQWQALKLFMDRTVKRNFTGLGGQVDTPKWEPIAPSMLGKIRYGTDHKQGDWPATPKRVIGSDGKTRTVMYCKSARRFTSSAMRNPLQASRGFLQSWGAISNTGESLVYGSNWYRTGNDKLARDIQMAGRGPRYVLPPENSAQFLLAVRDYATRFARYMAGKGGAQ